MAGIGEGRTGGFGREAAKTGAPAQISKNSCRRNRHKFLTSTTKSGAPAHPFVFESSAESRLQLQSRQRLCHVSHPVLLTRPTKVHHVWPIFRLVVELFVRRGVLAICQNPVSQLIAWHRLLNYSQLQTWSQEGRWLTRHRFFLEFPFCSATDRSALNLLIWSLDLWFSVLNAGIHYSWRSKKALGIVAPANFSARASKTGAFFNSVRRRAKKNSSAPPVRQKLNPPLATWSPITTVRCSSHRKTFCLCRAQAPARSNLVRFDIFSRIFRLISILDMWLGRFSGVFYRQQSAFRWLSKRLYQSLGSWIIKKGWVSRTSYKQPVPGCTR